MYTWLSRVMAFIFLLNVLSPAYAYTPLRQRRPVLPGDPVEQAHQSADSAAAATRDLYTKRQEYLDSVYTPAYEPVYGEYLSATNYRELDAAYKKLDALRRTGSGVMSYYQRQIAGAVQREMDAQNAASFEYYRQNPHVAPDAVSQTMGRDMRFPYSQAMIANATLAVPRSALCPSSSEFLDKLKNNKFDSAEEMLNYLDPLGLNCTDYMTVAYAAETLYYTVEEFSHDSVPEDRREELKVFLSHVKYRALASLSRLNGVKAHTEELYMARGTLRILLAMLENVNQANPGLMFEKPLCFMSPTREGWESYKREERDEWNKKHPLKTRGKMTTRTEYQAVPLNSSRYSEVQGFAFKPITKTKMSFEVIATKFPGAISYEDFVQNNAYFLESCPEELPKGWKAEEVTQSSIQENEAAWTVASNTTFVAPPPQNLPENAVLIPLAVLGMGSTAVLEQEFVNELKELKEKGSNAESKEGALLLLDMQYAARFAALLGDMQFLSDLVSMFEETPGKNIHGEYTQHRATDFNTKYSAALSVLFNSVYETLNGFQVRQVQSIFNFLKDMAGPSHATDTRVLALGTLSMLTQKTTSADEPSLRTEFVSNDGEQTIKYWLSSEDRARLAKYVADIYAPLQNTSTYGMEDYGLNAEQMLALSDQLVQIYMGFLPLYAPTVTLGPCMRVEKMDTENLQLITPGTFMGRRDGYYVDANCPQHYTKGGVFVFTSTGTVEMLLDNRINWKKKNDEITNKGMELLGESLLWVFGGAAVGGACRALRLLWGASKALPRAIRAGRIVYNTTTGTRVYRATAAVNRMRGSLNVGSKYMSNYGFNNYLARNGMSIETELFGSPAGRAASTALGPKLPPSPVGRITFTAGDVTGAGRSMSLPLFPGARPMAKWTIGDRVFSLRAAQRMGLRNTWTAADRALLQENVMFSPFIENATFRHPITGNFVSGPMLKPDIPLGSLFSNEPMLRAGLTAYGKTLRFFTLWQLGDITTGMIYRTPFDNWMRGMHQDEVNAEISQHSALSSESLSELEAMAGDGSAVTGTPGDIMTQVGGMPKEGFSWIDAMTFPSWVWQQIAPTEPGAVEGTMFLPPLIGGKYVLSQRGIGSNPFMTEAERTQIRIQAHQAALSKARIGRVNTQINESVEAILADIAKAQGELAGMFATLKQNFPGDWSAEEQAYQQFYNEYAEAVKEAGKIVNLQERSQRLEAVHATYAQRDAALASRVENKQNAIMLAQVAPEGEMAYWKSLVESLQTLKENTTYTMDAPGVNPVLREKFLPEYCAIIDGVIGKIKVLSQKRTTFINKRVEEIELLENMEQRLEQLFKKYNLLQPSTLDEPTFSDNLYELEEQQAY